MWKYKIGTVVKRSYLDSSDSTDQIWGHITGFSRNAFGETIVVVKWEGGYEGPIHTSNIILEEDEK